MAVHLKHHHPLILGWDISGTVVKIGRDVTKFRIGASNGDDMNVIANLLKDELLVPHISHVYSFSEMDKAHNQAESGSTVGKVVVTV